MVISKPNPHNSASVRSENDHKEEMIQKLQEESVSLITLAYLYAKRFEETGTDITEKWAVALEQNEILQQVYNKGFEEGLAKGRELVNEEIKKRISAINSDVNGNTRTGAIQRPLGNMVQPTNAQYHGKGKRKRHKR